MTTENSNSNSNSNMEALHIELSDKLSQENIIESYVLNSKGYFVLKLNHKYNKKTIPYQFDFDHYQKSMEYYERLMVNHKDVKHEHAKMVTETIDLNYEPILEFHESCKAAEEEEEEKQRESTTESLLKLAKEQCKELFVDQYGEPYAAVKIREHLETLNLNHTRFRNWICKAYYEQEGRHSVPNSESIINALNILKANAEFDGNSKELHLRVAYGDTKEEETGTVRTSRTTIFYDLTNKDWEAVKVSAEGWTIEKSPVIFRRHNAQPQVYPSKEKPPDIFDRFMNILNVKGEETKLLLKCYIIASFFPEFDKPILMLHGDPGGAKSTLQELVKTLVDPSSVLTFALPRDVNELVQQLDHNHIAFYDNVSKIPYWISDQFCRASTGAGSSKRRLFTDDDDKIYNFRRCVGFNGINLAASKSDLLDRGLIIRVERIDDKVKRKKEHIWHEFDEIRSELLGYIFDVVVKVLSMRQTTSIKFEKLPRMADFAETAEIISRCMGNPDNRFIDAYYENIKLQTEEILDASLVASAVVKFMSQLSQEEWNGTATELLEQLDSIVGEKTLKNKYWPKTSNVLSRRINEVKTNLREVGIFIEKGQADPITRVKTVEITKTSGKPEFIGKISLESFESFGGQNHAQVASDISNDISNDVSDIDTISLGKNPQNRAQNTSPNYMNDMNDISWNSTGSKEREDGITNIPDSRPKIEPDNEPVRPNYVYRQGHSDRFACRYCKVVDDKWGMAKHFHEAGRNQ